MRFEPKAQPSMLIFKVEMSRSCREMLDAGETELRDYGCPRKNWSKQVIADYAPAIGKAHVERAITALAHKMSTEADLMVETMSRKIDQIQFGFEMQYASHEKTMMARETAHTVKNLNTTAHHKLLELMEMELNDDVAEQVRQTLAIMMTAAHQTYQLSRVGEILRGEPPQLCDTLDDATASWQKICGNNFHIDSSARGLLVDGFRVVAVLSNAWNNALSHGDSTRMGETEMHIHASPPDSVEIVIINAAQEDAPAFDSIDESDSNVNLSPKNEFRSSP